MGGSRKLVKGARTFLSAFLTIGLAKPKRTRMCALLLIFFACHHGAVAQQWIDDLKSIKFTAPDRFLNRSNCIPLILKSFAKGEALKGIGFLPGATDEFYFFKRAEVQLPQGSLNLLDVCQALTNQTLIKMLYRSPCLLFHTSEDPTEPLFDIQDQKTAQKFQENFFERKFLYADKDWDFLHPWLSFHLNCKLLPEKRSMKSNHFFRPSAAGFDLTVWQAMELLSLASKTKVLIERKKVTFSKDPRFFKLPPLEGMRTFDP
jgi:hypothetical protein